MTQTLVVVANGAKARFFRVEPRDVPELESGPDLALLAETRNSEVGAHDRDVFASTKSGRNKLSRGGSKAAHAYDDHRSDHRDEFERRFAGEVAQVTADYVRTQKPRRLVLAAGPHMMGSLRKEINGHAMAALDIHECQGDVTDLSPRDLHKHLASQSLLPPRQPPRGPSPLRT